MFSLWRKYLTCSVLFLVFVHETSAGPWCFVCDGDFIPALCAKVMQCGDHEECYAESYLGLNGGIKYNSGCKATIECPKHRQARASHNRATCEECCEGDVCNEILCGGKEIHQPGTTICLDCDSVTKPSQCEKIRVCDQDELCSITKQSRFGFHFYELGCLEKRVCGNVGNQQNIDDKGFICCHGDICNSVIDSNVTTTTPAVATSVSSATPSASSESAGASQAGTVIMSSTGSSSASTVTGGSQAGTVDESSAGGSPAGTVAGMSTGGPHASTVTGNSKGASPASTVTEGSPSVPPSLSSISSTGISLGSTSTAGSIVGSSVSIVKGVSPACTVTGDSSAVTASSTGDTPASTVTGGSTERFPASTVLESSTGVFPDSTVARSTTPLPVSSVSFKSSSSTPASSVITSGASTASPVTDPVKVTVPQSVFKLDPLKSFLRIRCDAAGDPKPTVAWHKLYEAELKGDTNFHIYPDGDLFVTGLDPSVAVRGVYVCNATNGITSDAGYIAVTEDGGHNLDCKNTFREISTSPGSAVTDHCHGQCHTPQGNNSQQFLMTDAVCVSAEKAGFIDENGGDVTWIIGNNGKAFFFDGSKGVLKNS